MSGTVASAVVTAGLLGVTHAIEPDHVAGITSMTSEYGDSRLCALAGACFSLGHVLLVVAWLAVAYAVLGRTSFPAVFDAVGTVGVGVVLGAFGAVMTVGGVRRVVRTDEHEHGSVVHSHPHVSLSGFDRATHRHDTVASLKTGVVGALFTLSPPLSMIVFASTLLPDAGVSTVFLTVGSYAATITLTMSALGAGVGALFGRLRERGRQFHGAVRIVAGVTIGALAVSLLLDGTALLV